MSKNFVLDTNILIESPNAIFGFADNQVLITETTLEELDGLKKAAGETGYNARQAIRIISSLREKGDYKTGIPLDNGGTFRIVSRPTFANDPEIAKKPDNRILSAAMDIEDAILVTNDIAMQVKGTVMGLHIQDYHNMRVEDTEYEGRVVLETENWEAIQKLYSDGEINAEEVAGEYTFTENEYATLKSGTASVLCVYKNKKLRRIKADKAQPMGVVPHNSGQIFALDALMAPAEEIPLVILKGPAGSAKTFLSLAAGLDQTLDREYTKVVITRGNVLADRDIGYLKGTLEDKMDPLLAPFYDNLEVLLRGKNGKDEAIEDIQYQIEDLKESGKIEIASLAYMRGRSIANAFLIVDEVQNVTPGQILTIVTRMAQGAKLVLCGDPDQIDASNLDKHNNGLAFASERMKGSKLCAQMTFHSNECVRSPLASEGSERLKI